jgi:hypothetical protein
MSLALASLASFADLGSRLRRSLFTSPILRKVASFVGGRNADKVWQAVVVCQSAEIAQFG